MLKFLPFVLKNIARNRRRTTLTIIALAVSIFVFGSLLSINNGMDTTIKNSASDSIVTVFEKNRACPLTSNIPETYGNEIKSIAHVRSTTSELRYVTHYKTDNDEVSIVGVDAEIFREFKDIDIDDGAYNQLLKENNAAIVGSEIASYYDWKVGDEIVMKGGGISFSIKGIFSKPKSMWDSAIVTNKEYLQNVLDKEGRVTSVSVKVDNTDNIGSVTSAIDAMYSNVPSPTKSQSELSFWEAAMEEMAAMKALFSFMAMLSIFVTLVVAANSIAMSTRERTKEIGVLKSLGFRRGQILSLILFESTIIGALGGILGIGVAAILLASGPTLGQGLMVPPLVISPLIMIEGILASLLVGIIGGFMPAFQASRLDIVESLREVE